MVLRFRECSQSDFQRLPKRFKLLLGFELSRMISSDFDRPVPGGAEHARRVIPSDDQAVLMV